jgi:SAM-dependent methyltransferase
LEWLKLGPKKLEHYDGLLIMADSGLHIQVFSLINHIKESLDKDSIEILDVSAGEGAFSKRLFDHGFKVEAIDLDADNFKYSSIIPFHAVNLNDLGAWSSFVQSHRSKYDILVSQETIEHLEDPWSFLRGLKELVKPEGYLILTTPNIESPWSKLLFILRDRFFMFSDRDLEYGHINPLNSFEIEVIMRRIGMEIVEIYPGGSYPLIWIRRSVIDSLLWCGANILAVPFANKVNLSTCKIYLIQKSHP